MTVKTSLGTSRSRLRDSTIRAVLVKFAFVHENVRLVCITLEVSRDRIPCIAAVIRECNYVTLSAGFAARKPFPPLLRAGCSRLLLKVSVIVIRI
jgi:hypothetical protein